MHRTLSPSGPWIIFVGRLRQRAKCEESRRTSYSASSCRLIDLPKTIGRQSKQTFDLAEFACCLLPMRLPRELRRIIEFLNEQMRPAEVLGIEVEHYEAADGSRTLVPKTIGLTERASGVKSVVERPNVSLNEEWIARLRDTFGKDAGQGAAKAVELFTSLGCDVGPTQSVILSFARVDLGGTTESRLAILCAAYWWWADGTKVRLS